VRRNIGAIGVTFGVETGDMRLWERSETGPRGDRYRRYGYSAVTLATDGAIGPFAITGQLTRMRERDTVLGARFLGGLGGTGATSWFADTRVTLVPGPYWRMGVELRRGWTMVPAGTARSRSALSAQALAFDVTRTSIMTSSDSFSVRWSEPLRVTRGGIALTGLDLIDLTPAGHERDLEAVYARALGRGWLTVNSYWRQQPGNFAAAPDDIGGAVRYSFGF
jgi:hypothetical protein